MISRRAALLAGTSFLALPSTIVHARTEWKEGTHYQAVNPPLPTQSGRGRIEVAEFFRYGCPACYTLEPHLILWHHRRKEDTTFLRVPTAWQEQTVPHARLFFALRTLGREDLHERVFDSIHRLRRKLESIDEQIAFARTHGIEVRAFEQAYNSPATTAELKKSMNLARAYRITTIPAMAINGRYATDVRMAGSEFHLMSLLKYLIDQEREITERVRK